MNNINVIYLNFPVLKSFNHDEWKTCNENNIHQSVEVKWSSSKIVPRVTERVTMGILIKVSRSGPNHTAHVDKWCWYWISIESWLFSPHFSLDISIFYETRDTEGNLNPEIRFRCVRHMVRLNSILKHILMCFSSSPQTYIAQAHMNSNRRYLVPFRLTWKLFLLLQFQNRRRQTTETKATRAHHVECRMLLFSI